MLSARAERAERGAVIVTVHGTNDAASEDEGSRWWQKGSPFTDRLIGELARRGIADAEVVRENICLTNAEMARERVPIARGERVQDLLRVHRHGCPARLKSKAAAHAPR